MKEKLEELYDGLKERLKSNFLLTFIIVWLLHHWRLIYSIFNFSKEESLIMKRAYIEIYLDEQGYCGLLIIPLLWTFVSMITFYGFSSLSEILNIAYHNIRKSIYKKWDNKKLKTIEEFMEKVEENEKLQKMIKDLEQRRELLLGTNERLEKSIGEHNSTIANYRSTIETNKERITQLINEGNILKGERDGFKKRFEEAQTFKDRKAKMALFELLEFQSKNTSKITPEEIKIENVFLDNWLKIEYEDYKVPSYIEDIISFDEMIVKDKRGEFMFRISSFSRFFPNEIYLMNYVNKAHVECAELLIRVDSDLLIGRLSKKAQEATPLFVEYKRVAKGSIKEV